jgi:small-conductance mechanosensitive channel
MHQAILVAALVGFLAQASQPPSDTPPGDSRTTIQALLEQNKELTAKLEKVKTDEGQIAKAELELDGVKTVIDHADRAVKETKNGLEDEVKQIQAAANNGCPWGATLPSTQAAYVAGCNAELVKIQARLAEVRPKADKLAEYEKVVAEERQILSDKTMALAGKKKRNIADRALLDELSAKWVQRYNAFVFHSEAYEQLKKMEPGSRICERLSEFNAETAAGCLTRLWSGGH